MSAAGAAWVLAWLAVSPCSRREVEPNSWLDPPQFGIIGLGDTTGRESDEGPGLGGVSARGVAGWATGAGMDEESAGTDSWLLCGTVGVGWSEDAVLWPPAVSPGKGTPAVCGGN